MSTLLISNAQLVNEGKVYESDVFIRNGRIEQIGLDLSQLTSDQFIDGSGKHLLPGMIDSQFKLLPQGDFQENLARESKAAIAGGITSCLLLPSYSPEAPHPNEQFTTDYSKISLENNLSQYFSATQSSLDDIVSIDPSSCCGVYVDLASNSDELRVDDPSTLERVFKESPCLIALHAEDAPTILENEENYRQIYGDDIPVHFHGSIRSAEACAIAADEVLNIALNNNSRVHLLHVSGIKEIELLEKARQNSSTISAGVCSHYLTFSEADYEGKRGLLKCEPSIKSDIDRAALLQALLDNNIDSISSGHTPLMLEEKEGSYFNVSSGLPGAQFALPSILEHYQDDILSLECIVQKTSHAVADRYSIVDRGYIREGYWADLALVDLEGSFIARDEDVISASAWTIFNGNEFRSSVVTTIVNGVIVWSSGKFQSAQASGKVLKFGHMS